MKLIEAMLTKSTGMLVVLANRIKAEVHSFTCHTPIQRHVPITSI